MKTIYNYLKTYLSDNFSLPLYAGLTIWLTILFAFNYSCDFEDSYVDRIRNFPLRFLAHFLLMFIPFIGACFLIHYFKEIKFLREREFWIKILIGFGVLAFYRSAYFQRFFCDLIDMKACTFLYKVVIKFFRLAMLLLPLLIFYRRDKDQMVGFYGLTFIPKHLKIYLPALGIMAVVIFLSTFLPSIQKFYPMYFKSGGMAFAKYNHWPDWAVISAFEISYLSNFISVEFFFRGFLIFSFVRFFGPQVVLPAVCCYAVLHFGKPFVEAFSSIFGGYILSILALKTKNIWGGIFLHVGIAGMMELFTWLT